MTRTEDFQVCDYIAEGRNPQLYPKDCMEEGFAENAQFKGNVDAYRRFEALLLMKLGRVDSTKNI